MAGAGGAASEARRGRSPSSRRPRVLVVDDEPMLLRAIRRFLAGVADVVLAASGAEGESIVADDRDFDVVLCDLVMPGVCGIALYERLGSYCPELQRRMVFLTGGAFAERASDFLARVDNEVFEKPPDVGALRDLVRRFASQRS